MSQHWFLLTFPGGSCVNIKVNKFSVSCSWFRVKVDYMDCRKAFWVSKGVVDVKRAKVLGEIVSLIDVNVLVSKENNTTFSDQQSQIVLLLIGELRELKAVYFGTNMGSQVKYFGGLLENRGLCGVCTMTRIMMFKVFEGRILYVALENEKRHRDYITFVSG